MNPFSGLIRSATIVSVVTALLFAEASAAPSRKIVYESGDNVWVANIDGSGAKKLCRGSGPVISSDGARIAFQSAVASAFKDEKGAATPETHLAVIDLASYEIVRLKELSEAKVASPAWSPDGKRIAFLLNKPDAFFDLDLIGADGSGFKTLKKGETQTVQSYAAPCWARDGQSIFCHNTDTIYRLDLDGAVIAQWDLGKVLPQKMITSVSPIDISPDGSRLLLTCDYQADSDSAPTSLWIFHLGTPSAERLPVPKTLIVWSGCWLDNESILIEAGDDDRPKSTYRMSLDGKNLKCLIRNGFSPSVTKSP